MNKVVLLGRLTKDPDYRQNEVNENSSFCRFSLAVDRPRSRNADANQSTADFIPCVCFGRTAEFINKYFKKGDPIVVEGRIQTGSYTNKEGNRVYTTDIMVEKTEFVPKNAGRDGNSVDQNQSEVAVSSKDSFRDIPSGVDEELPFN